MLDLVRGGAISPYDILDLLGAKYVIFIYLQKKSHC